MKALVTGPDGVERPVHMGSYGIGPSRLVAAIIEAFHDEAGIKWPEPVAPFKAMILNLKQGGSDTDPACERLYAELTAKGIDTLYHDLDERPGPKFATADLIGIPWQILVGPRGLAEGKVEVKRRADGARELMTPADAVAPGMTFAHEAVCCARLGAPLRGLKPPESCETPGIRGDQTMMAESTGTHPFSPFEWMLSLRYLRARRKEGFISVIAGFSFLGIMLGVATLIIVMAVMNGFRQELLTKILGPQRPSADPAAGIAVDRLGRGGRPRFQGRRRPSRRAAWSKVRRWPLRRSMPPAFWCAASAAPTS